MMKTLFRTRKNKSVVSTALKRPARTYTVHETPPQYDGKINLESGIWRGPITDYAPYAPEEWFTLWAKAGWVPWTRNSDPEEDGIVFPFIRFDHDDTPRTFTIHDPNPKDIDDYRKIEILNVDYSTDAR